MVFCKRADTWDCVRLEQVNDMVACKRVRTDQVELGKAENKTCARNLDLGNQFWGSLCSVECCVGVLDNRLASHYLKHRNEMLGFYYLNFYINYPGIKIAYTQY